MKNTLWTIVAVLALILPFAAVGYELARREQLQTLLVYGAMVLLLAVTVAGAVAASGRRSGGEQRAETRKP